MANTGTELGALSEAINDKMDRDIQNRATGIQTVVETWHDDNGNFYRVWSDGWIEQGGVLNNLGTYPFYKSYQSIPNIYLSVGYYYDGNNTLLIDRNKSQPTTLTNQSFTLVGAGYLVTIIRRDGVSWYACGY